MSVGIELGMWGNPSSGSMTVEAAYFLRSDAYGHNWSNVLHRTGSISGDVEVSFQSGFGQTVVKEVARQRTTVALKYGATTRANFSAQLGPIWNGGRPEVTAGVTLPARPHVAPRPPKNPAAAWVADRRTRVTWEGDYTGATGAQPWSGVRVQRYTGSDKTWRTIAVLPWSATAFDDASAPLNEHTEYAIVAYNSAGQSPAAWAGTVNTRPATPVNVQAVKDGQDVIVSWEQKSSPISYITGYDVLDGGVVVGQVQGGASQQWTHVGPSTSTTHTYTVVAKTIRPALSSAQSLPSPTVRLLAPPDAPTLVAPSGYATPGQVELTWVHTPTDASRQTRAEVRHRQQGASSWTTSIVTGQAQKSAVDLQVGSWEWQARTWGSYMSGQEQGASPWAAVKTLMVVDAPTVQITNPPDGTVAVSSITVSWAYWQAQGSAQAGAQVEVARGGQVIEEKQVQGPATQAALDTRFEDGAAYTITIRVRSGHGIWSEVDTRNVTVDYPEPPAPLVEVTWDDQLGQALIQITNPAAGADQAETVSNTVERSVDGGATWEPVATDLPVSAALTDREGLSNGQTQYRVSAVSALPSSASTTVTLDAESWAIWLTGGQDGTTTVGLFYDPEHTLAPALLNREVHHFAGRLLGVEMAGTQRSRVIGISATLLDEDMPLLLRLEELALTPGPILYRDPAGRRLFASLSGVQLSRQLSTAWKVKAQVEEVGRG
ncbi:fibronectin type III domain-containing protein [Schaalia sp. 19OD2882]|uniref:fibronectin type III domain-containing protein n=1 Tax=Schaalia sp. 19OD2882 TaxID=2794089 RepID=UPI001C1EB69C|nr:fibronectin type III domain-containing protein [Schaalia sp. 19OD2882]QWW20125.1 fibronectin type III domain-containing protein [Schaalia sp. 19OD2882]